LHVSQDLIADNGKKNNALWDQIIEHYNQNRLIGLCEKIAMSWNQNGALENMMLLNSLLIIALSKLCKNLKH